MVGSRASKSLVCVWVDETNRVVVKVAVGGASGPGTGELPVPVPVLGWVAGDGKRVASRFRLSMLTVESVRLGRPALS